MPPITPQPQFQPQSPSQSHPRSPSTTSDENNTVTWEHLEHAPPSLSTQSINTTAHDNNNRSTAENHSKGVIGHEMHARSEAVHVEDMMDIPKGTGTVTGMGPGASRAPAIRIHPPGDTVSTSVSGASGVGGPTKSASFSGR